MSEERNFSRKHDHAFLHPLAFASDYRDPNRLGLVEEVYSPHGLAELYLLAFLKNGNKRIRQALILAFIRGRNTSMSLVMNAKITASFRELWHKPETRQDMRAFSHLIQQARQGEDAAILGLVSAIGAGFEAQCGNVLLKQHKVL